MNKKEKNVLHSDKCNIEHCLFQSGRGLENRFILSMSLTANELQTLQDSLAESLLPVAEDLLNFLRNAAYRSGIKL